MFVQIIYGFYSLLQRNNYGSKAKWDNLGTRLEETFGSGGRKLMRIQIKHQEKVIKRFKWRYPRWSSSQLSSFLGVFGASWGNLLALPGVGKGMPSQAGCQFKFSWANVSGAMAWDRIYGSAWGLEGFWSFSGERGGSWDLGVFWVLTVLIWDRLFWSEETITNAYCGKPKDMGKN